MTDTATEHKYLYLSSMLIVFASGFGAFAIFNNELVGISAMFVAGGFLIYLRTIMTIKIAELEIRLTPVSVEDT